MVVLDRTRLTGQLISLLFFIIAMTLKEYLSTIHNKSIAVIGIGISNLPLLELLCSEGCDVTACDRRSMEELGDKANRLLSLGAKLCLGESYLDHLEQDLIFRTPGLMPFDKHLTAARQRGSIVTSEMEVFLSLCPCKVFAVTGSDGKTTTTTLISELLKKAGYHVYTGGNIGTPLLCKLPEMNTEDMVVVELSSFQLHSMKCRPHTAVITNLSPNHLDKHLDFQDYMDAKSWIFRNQCPNDRLILNAMDPHSSYYASLAHSRISYFSDQAEILNGCICKDHILSFKNGGQLIPIMDSEEIRIPGSHNIQNMLAAFEAVRDYVSPELCRSVAMEFPGVPHRLEEIRQLNGVTYINDSIASSPTRTIAGLNALKVKPIIIVGGYDKHIPFDFLGIELCKKAKTVILCGDTADKIAAAIEKASIGSVPSVSMFRTTNLKDAVRQAHQLAVSGDVVMLSPACASFDQFSNFEERGNAFRKYVLELDS